MMGSFFPRYLISMGKVITEDMVEAQAKTATVAMAAPDSLRVAAIGKAIIPGICMNELTTEINKKPLRPA